MLKKHEAAWRQLAWTEHTHLPHLEGRLTPSPAVSGSCLIFPSRGSPLLKPIIQHISSKLRGVAEQHTEFPAHIPYGSLVDHAQDISVVLEIAQGHQRYCFRSLSTGEGHPLACHAGFLEFDRIIPGRQAIETCGEYLLETLSILNHTSPMFQVWNWKTGVIETSLLHPDKATATARFLDSDHLIIGDANSMRDFGMQSFRIVRFRDSRARTGDETTLSSSPSYMFLLPSIMQKSTLTSWTLPPRMSSLEGSFRTDPEERLLFVRSIPFANHSLTFEQRVVHLDIPVRTFLSYIAAHPLDRGNSITVPWDEWGPRGTCLTQESPNLRIGVMSVSGMRRIGLRRATGSGHAILTLIDYHPRRVARALQHDPASVELQDEKAPTTLPRLVKEIPLPDGLVDEPIDYETFTASLHEDGVLFIQYAPHRQFIRNVWAYTI
ncbi:hypothetical protein BV25DRAFT_1321056 [Artomyces pyxidatus]|uniref:Uncharacterized protein n=1 Tax=Artomyces pyxidatus TaxID=48021 RepID=A0ACB8SNZ5_9AGAM|nr:hypothetical protein BV25DRAFT_1321056 [Artomyces pyxidatus]